MKRVRMPGLAALLLILILPAGACAARVDADPQRLGAREALVDLMVKQPHLVYPGDPTRMKVQWQLSTTWTSLIEWGPDTTCSAGSLETSESAADHVHDVTLTDLTPGTRYHYRVTTYGVTHGGSFVSAPPPDRSTLKFVAYGDTRTYAAIHNQVCGAMVSAFTADTAYQTLALVVGDLVTNGDSESDWATMFFSPSYPSIQKFLASMPFQSCMGNHENSGVLFTRYFPAPFVAGRYWSFDYGPAHVAVVDQFTDYSPGSPQLEWLAADLAGSAKTWKFVVLHEPGWSAAGGHPNNLDVQARIQPLCVQHGVSIVFGGHNHYYARALVDGVQHVTTGGGGAPLATPVMTSPNLVTATSANHYCLVEIDGGALHLRAVTPAGALIDSFTITRSPVAVPREAPAADRPELERPRPNPGQHETWLAFTLSRPGTVRLEILDLTGRRVWKQCSAYPAGPHRVRWDGRDGEGREAGSGLYIVRLVSPWGSSSQRLVWLR